MQLFFWIDPEILEDPLMANCHSITLSYTFFNTGEEEEEEEEEEQSSSKVGHSL